VGAGGAAATRSRSVGAWRNAVMTAFALGGIAISTWGPRLAELRSDLGVDNAEIGIVLAGVTVGAVAGLGAATALLSRLGPRLAIRAMLWVTGISIGLIGVGGGLGHSVEVTAAGFLLVGFGIGAVDVMMNVEGAAVQRAADKTLMPLLHAAWSAGAVVGAGIGAMCAELRVDLQWQFLGVGVLIMTAAGVATGFIPLRGHVALDVSEQSRMERVREWLRGWTNRRLLLIGLVMLGVELGEGTANSWLPLAVREGHHRPAATAAWFLVIFAVGEMTARVTGGPLVDRVGRVRAVQVTTGLGAAGLVVFIFASASWAILLGTVLWAVGVSMGFPLGMSAAADSGPHPAAQVSVVASIGYIANLAGPPAIGFLSGAVGVLDALWLVFALLVLGFAAAGALGPTPAKS
jgi:MFS family permease